MFIAVLLTLIAAVAGYAKFCSRAMSGDAAPLYPVTTNPHTGMPTMLNSRVLPPHVTVFVPEVDIRAYMRSNRALVLLSAPATEGGYYVTIKR